jgi:hypothetical protein
MFRLARRHRDVAEDEGPVSPDVMRRRLIAAGIVVAMIVAAVVGVVVATSGKPAHRGPTAAQIRTKQQQQTAARRKAQAAAAATAAANQQLETILTGLAHTRARTLIRLANEKNPTTQVRDAVTVQKAYSAARRKVVPLEPKTTAANPLAQQLGTLAGDYGRLAQAGRANKALQWNRVFNTITADEKALQSLVGKL